MKFSWPKIFKKEKKPEIKYTEVKQTPGASSGRHNNGPFNNSFSGGAKYHGGLSGNGTSHFIDNRRVRQNARNAYHDTPEAKALVNRFADTIVDTGLKLEATPDSNILGISLEEAEEWGNDVDSRFDSWAKTKLSNRSESMTFYQAQRLYQISQQRDNDIFVRLHYSKDSKLLNPLQFSFLDPNQIRGDAITSTHGVFSCKDGISRDAAGREISYSVFQKNQKTCAYEIKEIPRVGRISGRTMMIHGYMPEYVNQGRGYSRLEHILQEFEDMTDFKLSTIKKAISQSQISMYTKPSENQPATNPFEDLAKFTSGPASVSGLDNEGNENTVVANNKEHCIDYEPIPTAANRVPGEIGVFNLGQGEDLKPFETKMDSENFKEFVESYMSFLSASSGMPVEVLLMKFGTNYSASRAALILFWRVAEIWRGEMAADLLNPIYESWLSEEIAAGRIKATGFGDPIIRQAWLNASWAGAPMPNIDPMRTAKAEMAYAEMGATNLDRVARDYNGSNGKANRQKLKRQYEELPIATWNRTEKTELVDPDKIEDD